MRSEFCLNYCYAQQQLKYYSSCAMTDLEYDDSIEESFLSQNSDYNYFDIKVVEQVKNEDYDKFINAFNTHVERVERTVLHLSNTVNLDGTCTPLIDMKDKLLYIVNNVNTQKLGNLEFNNKKIANEYTNDNMIVDFVKESFDASRVTIIQTIYQDSELSHSVDEILLDV